MRRAIATARKRPLMGAVASRLSDVVVVTSDNPRSEDPARIIEEVKLGMPGAERTAGALLAIVDRADAIVQAIGMAEPGDLVLLAGKGHEKTQVIGGRNCRSTRWQSRERARAAARRIARALMTLGDDRRRGGRSVAAGGRRPRWLHGFSIDTRTLQPGDLFFAIRGRRFDGQRFVGDAERAGAVGGGGGTARSAAPAIPVLVVDDTVAALSAARRVDVRRRSGTRRSSR